MKYEWIFTKVMTRQKTEKKPFMFEAGNMKQSVAFKV